VHAPEYPQATAPKSATSVVTPFLLLRFLALFTIGDMEKIILICLLVAFISLLASWSKT
jgi:hypothetical protein